MRKFTRSPNLFEKFLLIIGVFIIILGYGFISNAIKVNDSNYWMFLQTIFLWLLLAIMVILLAVNENMKEELKLISEEQLEEIRLLNRREKMGLKYEADELEEIKNIKRGV